MYFYFVALLLVLTGMPSQAGLANGVGKVGREVIEHAFSYIIKKTGKEATEEISESAAKKLVREAMAHSDDVAKIAKEFGEEGLVQIAKSPVTRRLYSEAGEDAAVAILKHGDLGVELLKNAPKGSLRGVATALRNMDKPASRRLVDVLRTAGNGAEDVLAWIARHPRLATAGAIGALVLASPTLRAALGFLLDHPITSISLFLIIAALLWFLSTFYLPFLIAKLRRKFEAEKKC